MGRSIFIHSTKIYATRLDRCCIKYCGTGNRIRHAWSLKSSKTNTLSKYSCPKSHAREPLKTNNNAEITTDVGNTEELSEQGAVRWD